MDKLGLRRDIDLVLHIPLRYEDETRLTPIGALREGESAQVQGEVTDCRIEQRSRRQLLVRLRDEAGDELLLRFLNFYATQPKAYAVGVRLRARGEVRGGFLGHEMVHPACRVVDEHTPLATTLTPVYPTSAQLPQAYLRKAVASALQRAPLAEVLPEGTLPRGLPTLREALQWLHHPPPTASVAALEDRSHPAWQRLKFEELLAQQLSQLRAKLDRQHLQAPVLAGRPSPALPVGGAPRLVERLLAALPFQLTGAQRRVTDEIAADLARGQPMHRLLQGDVGSGKTVVAALAAALAIESGWQCALMAPTEILAEQHFAKLVQWLEPLGVGVAWLTGSRKGKGRTAMLQRIASGDAMLVVGTHAVIQDDVQFLNLGLAIVDEQHRFGVAQRLALRDKLAGPGADAHDAAAPAPSPPVMEPHLLMMSATPIPRTLAMSYFADLDVSTIDELPPGRTPVLTKVFADTRREQVIARIGDEIAAGRQVYWVCPLIEDAEAAQAAAQAAGQAAAQVAGAATAHAAAGAADSSPAAVARPRKARPAAAPGHDRPPMPELTNVIETHAELSAALPGAMVGLLHGRMPAPEKAAVMSLFSGGKMSVLVATTVIEVGVDVPNASLMVIEHAERFGLSQLHQLRGRVGRGAAASVCVLLYSAPLSPSAKQRLRAMSETTDGFEIARRDLEIRGPGEFMGERQSGDALLRFADLSEDAAWLRLARSLAPRLWQAHPEAAAAHVSRWLGNRADFLKA